MVTLLLCATSRHLYLVATVVQPAPDAIQIRNEFTCLFHVPIREQRPELISEESLAKFPPTGLIDIAKKIDIARLPVFPSQFNDDGSSAPKKARAEISRTLRILAIIFWIL